MGHSNRAASNLLKAVGDFPEHWRPSTLQDACSLVTDGTHDSPKRTTTGFPLVTGKCITKGRIDFEPSYLISEEEHRNCVARSHAELGDILFANIGNSIGDLARVETDIEFSIKNVALFKPSDRLDGLFLKYYLLSPAVQDYIQNTTFGSAQPFIGLGTLRAFPVPLPPLNEQRAIARILGTLDDKIELNRRMNGTLEEMAAAIFKAWFVDFEPVKAKAAGAKSFPSTPQPIFDALPTEFTDSPLGQIPKGWSAGGIGDIGRCVRKGVRPQEVDPTTPYIGLEHMPRHSISLGDWGLAGNVGSNKSTFQRGEILFGKLRPYFHKVGVAVLDGVCSTDILVVAPMSAEWFGLLLGHLSSVEFVNFVNAASTGTKMPRTNWKDMARYEIALPSGSLAGALASLIRPKVELTQVEQL